MITSAPQITPIKIGIMVLLEFELFFFSDPGGELLELLVVEETVPVVDNNEVVEARVDFDNEVVVDTPEFNVVVADFDVVGTEDTVVVLPVTVVTFGDANAK